MFSQVFKTRMSVRLNIRVHCKDKIEIMKLLIISYLCHAVETCKVEWTFSLRVLLHYCFSTTFVSADLLIVSLFYRVRPLVVRRNRSSEKSKHQTFLCMSILFFSSRLLSSSCRRKGEMIRRRNKSQTIMKQLSVVTCRKSVLYIYRL